MTQIEPLVNLFIIGAPKCGTTAMASYLASHSNICMSTVKEPHFFCDDFPHIQSQTGIRSVQAYHKTFFEHLDKKLHTIGAEASVWYLYSEVAVKNILNYNPNAQFMILLRNPIEMIQSLHSMYLGLGFEYESNLEKAFQLEKTRLSGVKVKQHPLADPPLLIYSQIGKLGEQLRRFYELVPKSQAKVILHDDFREDPASSYKDILKFLNVDTNHKIDFTRINDQKLTSSFIAHHLYTNQQYRKAAQLLKKILRIKSFGLGVAKIPINDQHKEKMIDLFQDDISVLSSLLNRNLDHWME